MHKQKERKRSESFYQGLVQKYITKRYGCATVRELNFGGPKFDVVGFSPDSGEFHIAECKRTARPVGIGQTFGQILAYKSMIYEAGETFLTAFERHLSKDGFTNVTFWTHAARYVEGGKIPIRFYVALRESACQRTDFLRLMKRDLKDVGIIRINKYNQCRDYVRVHGQPDYELCESTTVDVPISAPVRPVLKKILESQGCNQIVAELAGKIDSGIMKMNRGMKSVPHGSHSMFYRVEQNFVGLHPKKEFIRISIRINKQWKKKRIKAGTQVRALFSKIRKALGQSLEE
jgi:hypothetical protein